MISDRMSDSKIEIDPFSETALEFQSCEGKIINIARDYFLQISNIV